MKSILVVAQDVGFVNNVLKHMNPQLNALTSSCIKILGLFFMLHLFVIAYQMFSKGESEGLTSKLLMGLLYIILLTNMNSFLSLSYNGVEAIITGIEEDITQDPRLTPSQQIAAQVQAQTNTGGRVLSDSEMADMQKVLSQEDYTELVTRNEALKQSGQTDSVSFWDLVANGESVILYAVATVIEKFVGLIARITILLFGNLLIIILIMLLPLAIVFNWMPGLKGNLSGYFGTMLAVKFWYLVVVILDGLSISASAAYGEVLSSTHDTSSALLLVCLKVLIAGAYLAIPFLTQLVIPSEGGSMFTAIAAASFSTIKTAVVGGITAPTQIMKAKKIGLYHAKNWGMFKK